MPLYFWTVIELKLESAERHLAQASQGIRPQLSAHYAAIQSSGAIISNPLWRSELSSQISAFLADCRSVPDLIQSYFGADPKPDKKWLSKLPSGEKTRRDQYQLAFRRLYQNFSRLLLSRARVDTVHRQGFPEIWGKAGKPRN